MWRFYCLLFLVGNLLVALVCPGAESAEVNLGYVAHRAYERALKPFHSPREDLPKVLLPDNLNYDKYREIRFRRDHALWAADNLPFRIEFFHPGYLFQEPVHINEFTLTHTQPIRFVQDFFDYGKLTDLAKQIPAKTGYAGFRILYMLNQTNQFDELGVFQGASYFRLLGKDQHYGQSARGLAIDCGENDRPEEFPIFTDWWLGKPNMDDTELRFYAILDSVSCVGAYEFLLRPGETTVCDVDAILYLRQTNTILAVNPNRKPIDTIGLAPLSSMFWFGKNTEHKPDDYRSEVHDTDGLLVHMGNGEVFWRPLDNPPAMRHQIFHAPDIRGFGLLQRERNFSAYQDMFNLYHMTPSVWIEPRKDWGDGDLHLVELSTTYEGLDNIAVFWDPKVKPAPLQAFHFGYTMRWTRETDLKISTDKVVATRVGLDTRFPGARQFVIDFDGPDLDALPINKPPVAIASCSSNAVIADNYVVRNTFAGTWRVYLTMQPKAGGHDPVDVRCTLHNGNQIASETWTYLWSPP
jgi:periplasmic glucans biosynthesis protein